MSVRRLAQPDLFQPGEPEEGAVGGEPEVDAGAEDPGTLDLSSLYSLLQKTLQTQEREAFKQEQRWRSVQMQLNGFHDELEQEQRSGVGGGEAPAEPPAMPPAAPPAESPIRLPDAPLYPATPSPVSWTRQLFPNWPKEMMWSST